MAKVLETYEPMLTLPFGNGHIGIDIVGNNNGWGAIDDLIAVESGTIEAIETRCNTVYNDVNSAIRDWGHSYGNYVLINHGIINGHEYKTRYAHESYGSNNLLYVGQYIPKGGGLGSMGNTGNTCGAHLHFELIRDGITIDPYKLIFEGKEISDLDEKPVTIPEPVEQNEKIDQVRVVCGTDTLRVRKGHSINDEIIGFAIPGFYNIISFYIDSFYTWYEIEENKWIASAEGCTVYYSAIEEPINEPIIEPEPINEPITPEEPETSENEPENTENEPFIEPINQDKKNPLIEFIKWILKLISKIINKG